jgi:hypothetical protein
MVAIFFGRLRREEFSLPTGSWHRPVGNETTVCDQSALKVDCGQLVPVRQRDDQLTMKLPECTRRQDLPVFGVRANALIVRSIWPASCTSTIFKIDLRPRRGRR